MILTTEEVSAALVLIDRRVETILAAESKSFVQAATEIRAYCQEIAEGASEPMKLYFQGYAEGLISRTLRPRLDARSQPQRCPGCANAEGESSNGRRKEVETAQQ